MPEMEVRFVLTVDSPLSADDSARLHRDAAKAILENWGVGSYEANNYDDRHVERVRFLQLSMETSAYPSEIYFPVTQQEEREQDDDDDDF